LNHKEKERAYPSISIIRLRRSNSEAPGNNGNPRNNSATMHPKDHMSIAVVYLEKGLRTKQNTHNNRMKDNGMHKSHLRFQTHQIQNLHLL